MEDYEATFRTDVDIAIEHALEQRVTRNQICNILSDISDDIIAGKYDHLLDPDYEGEQ